MPLALKAEPTEHARISFVPPVRKQSKSPAQERYLIPVVVSTFRILQELSSAETATLNELVTRTKIPKSTVFRVLTTLTQLGYLDRDEDKRSYRINSTLADLSTHNSTLESLRLAALPHMLRLRDLFGETVNLGHLTLDRVTYLEVVPSEHALRLTEKPGATVTVYATALGRAILAWSPEELRESILGHRSFPAFTPHTITEPDKLREAIARVKVDGYAIDEEETSLQANCIGVPIVVDGRAVAALSISGPTQRFRPRENKQVARELTKAAEAVAKTLRKRR
jgi:DNA-binding IclR family transcriptional regulator